MIDVSEITRTISAFRAITEKNSISPEDVGSLLQQIVNIIHTINTNDFEQAISDEAKIRAEADEEINNAIDAINNLLNGNASVAINSLQEVISFLEGLKDDSKLSSIINSLQATDKDFNMKIVRLQENLNATMETQDRLEDICNNLNNYFIRVDQRSDNVIDDEEMVPSCKAVKAIFEDSKTYAYRKVSEEAGLRKAADSELENKIENLVKSPYCSVVNDMLLINNVDYDEDTMEVGIVRFLKTRNKTKNKHEITHLLAINKGIRFYKPAILEKSVNAGQYRVSIAYTDDETGETTPIMDAEDFVKINEQNNVLHGMQKISAERSKLSLRKSEPQFIDWTRCVTLRYGIAVYKRKPRINGYNNPAISDLLFVAPFKIVVDFHYKNKHPEKGIEHNVAFRI